MKRNFNLFCFYGNEVTPKLLEEVSSFRCKSFSDYKITNNFDVNLPDISITDLRSYHLLAHDNTEIIGALRLSPPGLHTPVSEAFTRSEYENLLIQNSICDTKNIWEANRLCSKKSKTQANVGIYLVLCMFALLECLFPEERPPIIAASGTKRAQNRYFVKKLGFKELQSKEIYNHNFEDYIKIIFAPHSPYPKNHEIVMELVEQIKSGEISTLWKKPQIDFNLENLIKEIAI